MKNFIRAAAFVLLFALSFTYFNSNYKNSDYYVNMYSINSVENADVVNVGSSHGQHDFDYSQIPQIEGLSLAHSSQSFYYDYELVFEYGDMISDTATVIIPISYFSLYDSLDSQVNKDVAPRYYRILKTPNVYGFNIKDAIFYRYLPLLSAKEHWTECLPDFMKEVLNQFLYTKASYTVEGSDAPEMPLNELGARRAEFHYNTMIGKQIADTGQKEYLYKLIDLCYERGYRPVLITTPFMDYYNRNFPNSFYEKFESDVQNILSDYPAIHYLDYSHDDRFENNEKLFLDTDHLNEDGAKLFTSILLDDINRFSPISNY